MDKKNKSRKARINLNLEIIPSAVRKEHFFHNVCQSDSLSFRDKPEDGESLQTVNQFLEEKEQANHENKVLPQDINSEGTITHIQRPFSSQGNSYLNNKHEDATLKKSGQSKEKNQESADIKNEQESMSKLPSMDPYIPLTKRTQKQENQRKMPGNEKDSTTIANRRRIGQTVSTMDKKQNASIKTPSLKGTHGHTDERNGKDKIKTNAVDDCGIFSSPLLNLDAKAASRFLHGDSYPGALRSVKPPQRQRRLPPLQRHHNTMASKKVRCDFLLTSRKLEQDHAYNPGDTAFVSREEIKLKKCKEENESTHTDFITLMKDIKLRRCAIAGELYKANDDSENTNERNNNGKDNKKDNAAGDDSSNNCSNRRSSKNGSSSNNNENDNCSNSDGKNVSKPFHIDSDEQQTHSKKKNIPALQVEDVVSLIRERKQRRNALCQQQADAHSSVGAKSKRMDKT